MKYIIAIILSFLFVAVTYDVFKRSKENALEKQMIKMEDCHLYLVSLKDSIINAYLNDTTLNKDSLETLFYTAQDSCLKECDKSEKLLKEVKRLR